MTLTLGVAARPRHTPALDSAAHRNTREVGAPMQVLDVIERLLNAAERPDIVAVERYGPGDGPWGPTVAESKVKGISGVKVTHQSTATASLWGAVKPGEVPVDTPTVMPPPQQARATRLLILAVRLLDAAKPEQFRAWRLVAFPDLGATDRRGVDPCGLSIVGVDGQKYLLLATATGPTLGSEPDEEPFPDYVIPEGVKTCLQASATSAAR